MDSIDVTRSPNQRSEKNPVDQSHMSMSLRSPLVGPSTPVKAPQPVLLPRKPARHRRRSSLSLSSTSGSATMFRETYRARGGGPLGWSVPSVRRYRSRARERRFAVLASAYVASDAAAAASVVRAAINSAELSEDDEESLVAVSAIRRRGSISGVAFGAELFGNMSLDGDNDKNFGNVKKASVLPFPLPPESAVSRSEGLSPPSIWRISAE